MCLLLFLLEKYKLGEGLGLTCSLLDFQYLEQGLACGKQSFNMYEMIEGKGKEGRNGWNEWGERKRKGRRGGRKRGQKGVAYWAAARPLTPSRVYPFGVCCSNPRPTTTSMLVLFQRNYKSQGAFIFHRSLSHLTPDPLQLVIVMVVIFYHGLGSLLGTVSRGSSQPRDRAQVSYIAGGFFTSWAQGKPIWLTRLSKINQHTNMLSLYSLNLLYFLYGNYILLFFFFLHIHCLFHWHRGFMRVSLLVFHIF